MSDGRTEERLEAMLGALRARPARLDEIAQARVRARLEAALAEVDAAADAAEVRTVGRWRRVGIAGGVGLAAAAAVIAVVVAARTGGRATGTTATADQAAPADPASTVADRAAIAGRTAPPAPPAGTAASTVGPADPGRAADTPAAKIARPATTSSTPVTVAANESVQLALGGAEVTLYGPGRLSPTSDGAVVDAAGVVIDRPRGDAPWSVHYRDARIAVTRATFAIEGGAQIRVSVIRGEVQLYCPSGMRTIRSGGSAACEPATEIRATPHHRPPGSSSGAHELASQTPARPVPEPQAPAPQPSPVELYATAESALGRGDLDAAQDALLAVVNASPDSLDAATALLDLARLAARRGDPSGALDYLARLDHHPRRDVLAAPAARLRETLLRSGSHPARPTP